MGQNEEDDVAAEENATGAYEVCGSQVYLANLASNKGSFAGERGGGP